jgi:hypothetical protein
LYVYSLILFKPIHLYFPLPFLLYIFLVFPQIYKHDIFINLSFEYMPIIDSTHAYLPLLMHSLVSMAKHAQVQASKGLD